MQVFYYFIKKFKFLLIKKKIIVNLILISVDNHFLFC